MKWFTTAVCGALATLAVGPTFPGGGQARAAIITFDRSAPFFAAVGTASSFTEGYETPPVNTILASGSTLNNITYTFPAGVSGRIDNLFNRFGDQSLAASRPGAELDSFFFPGESFTITFSQPVFGVGIFINAGVSATNSDYFLSTPVGTATTGGPNNYDTSSLYFVGLLSDTPFTSATIGALAVGPTSGHNVDNLTLVFAAPAALVPEPASVALLGAGAFGLLGYGWRRARARAVRKGE